MSERLDRRRIEFGMKGIYLGLGANLGDRSANLGLAITRLRECGICTVMQSSLYETEPQDVVDQPVFLNAVIEVETELVPLEALRAIQRIEAELGRRPTISKGPRLIDIDILAWGSVIIDSKELRIPHPGLQQRRFVLAPLAEIAPGWRHPESGKTVEELLAPVSEQGIRQIRPRSGITF